MVELTLREKQNIEAAQRNLYALFSANGISVHLQNDFERYTSIRREHGDVHLNQAFDPQYVKLGDDDFWLLAENSGGEAIATYCLRRFIVEDFFALIRSLTLWFSRRPHRADRRFVVQCPIVPFGGAVVHGGGLWVRDDYRGFSRLAVLMPHFARAVALRHRPFDHDSAMIRNQPADPMPVAERKAAYMGKRVYGYARVGRFVDGWFPPEGRKAVMHLCHSTRAEAIASLSAARLVGGGLAKRSSELREFPLVDQDYKPVNAPAVLGEGQQHARI